MSLLYDFDIVERPAEGDVPAQVCARFRDVKTSDALRGASPGIRMMFQDAGFDLDSHVSGIVPDKFPTEDLPDRTRILRTLFDNIKTRGVRGEYCGEFDLRHFLGHIRRAEAVDGLVRIIPVQHPPTPQPDRPKRRTAKGRIGVGLGVAVILFAVLKYFAEAGATP
ncbi:hypothetical protein J7394_06690 [Ruegeria sp. R13_0]|uniref:hypothetical protein n=1 Tax=Ruegeria sp. R13_0 TaxID=2821099 RepID=UPI001ADC907F|nr:hypothetical protein [Ruegeria sp. R13_0]MBO9433883.1 hypothetical protein [Ruegeria sp. R13_0]